MGCSWGDVAAPSRGPLNITDSKLLGVSVTGELAFLRGPHEAVKLLAPTRTGTLSRVPMTGGGPRELLDDVIAADWTPDGADLAVVRREHVEFPPGTKIHGRHAFTYVRVAPDGQRLALVEKPNIILLDRSGQKTTLSTGWGDLTTVAWSPSGGELWFSGSRAEDLSTWGLRSVSLRGRVRVLLPPTGDLLSLQDVLPDGRALVARHVAKMGCLCLPPGETQLRDAGWLDGSGPEALSADGRTVLLAEMLRGRTGRSDLSSTHRWFGGSATW
jgi:hypothetical protein